ncbi:MAG: class 1 fructose-bisphosphatase [Rickettsiales bacterium]|nr:class 1 fructose-bisphosphatase [Rickettsiales bacterium]|tara:strand:- start:4468 stop:5475 length:1008 start_codon:yes stop_codon:yes gene_type:complete
MQGTTLTQHIRASQLTHDGARGSLTALLTQIGVAGKVISSKVNMAGLVKILGSTGRVNVQGEVVQKLDEYAEHTIQDIVGGSGYVCALLSEELQSVIEIPPESAGDYIIAYDPLDGSSNIDANVSIGTIFGIYRKQSSDPEVTRSDTMRPGSEMLAAGYIIYGSSTMFVYTVGDGVHGFTLDPMVGEYVLSHENIRLPAKCKTLSINHCNAPYWPAWTHDFVGQLLARNDTEKRRVTCRHIGSLVADFHRNLMYGGVFLYPTDERIPRGKLRLLYEAAPLAMLAEQAGGCASDGERNIRSIVPEDLHHRTGLIIGNAAEVKLAEECVRAARKRSI